MADETFDQIDGHALNQLMMDVAGFAERRAEQLGLSGGLVATVYMNLVVATAVNMHLPPSDTRATFDEAMREAVPRFYDASYSIKDWIERKVPWRMQSHYMRNAPDLVVGLKGGKGFDA